MCRCDRKINPGEGDDTMPQYYIRVYEEQFREDDLPAFIPDIAFSLINAVMKLPGLCVICHANRHSHKLPCPHSVCRGCLSSMHNNNPARTNNSSPANCPSCRRPFDILQILVNVTSFDKPEDMVLRKRYRVVDRGTSRQKPIEQTRRAVISYLEDVIEPKTTNEARLEHLRSHLYSPQKQILHAVYRKLLTAKISFDEDTWEKMHTSAKKIFHELSIEWPNIDTIKKETKSLQLLSNTELLIDYRE